MPIEEAVRIFKLEFPVTGTERQVFLSIPNNVDPEGRFYLDHMQNIRMLFLKYVFSPTAYAFAGLEHPLNVSQMNDRQLSSFYLKQAEEYYSVGYDGMKMVDGYPSMRKAMKRSLCDKVYDQYYSLVLRHVYSARYRDAQPTMLTQGVMVLLEIKEDDDLMEILHPDHLNFDKTLQYELDKLLFRCAEAGDATAQLILNSIAHTLAESTAGCIKGLKFERNVTVVLAGSLWVKGGYPQMRKTYCDEVMRRVSCECDFVVLQEPPAIGAIYEAYRRLTNGVPSQSLREKVAVAFRE